MTKLSSTGKPIKKLTERQLLLIAEAVSNRLCQQDIETMLDEQGMDLPEAKQVAALLHSLNTREESLQVLR